MSTRTITIYMALLLPLITVGCSDVTLSGTGDDDQGSPEPTFPEFDGATLQVDSPVSGSIILLEEEAELEAVVLSAAGEPLDFDAIEWTTDRHEDILFEGRSGSAGLDAGIHAITATAELPNGDRLQTTLGGIRVQGLHTGIYSGSLNMDLSGEFQGTPIATSCAGALDFVVDMQGEVIQGAGECSLSLLVLGSIDVAYNVDGDIEENDAAGNVSLDLGFFPLDLDWEGGFENEDTLVGSFEGQMLMFDMEGTIDAHRVSPYVDP